MQAVLFGNPYLSFYITTLPEESKQTIRFWLDYWKKNYQVIFDGNFEPMQVSRFYPVIKVENDHKLIYAVYEDYTINIPKNLTTPLEVINSKKSGAVSFMLSDPSLEYKFETFDCVGRLTEKGILKSKKKNTIDAMVPAAGYIRVTSL